MRVERCPQTVRLMARRKGLNAYSWTMQSICGELQNPRGRSSQFGPPILSTCEHFAQLDCSSAPTWELGGNRQRRKEELRPVRLVASSARHRRCIGQKISSARLIDQRRPATAEPQEQRVGRAAQQPATRRDLPSHRTVARPIEPCRR